VTKVDDHGSQAFTTRVPEKVHSSSADSVSTPRQPVVGFPISP
jgi:hypothetical protein